MKEDIRSDSKTKWIVVTGGVVSGLGKGVAAASIARLLKPAPLFYGFVKACLE